MHRIVLAVVLLALTPTAGAQTCGGTLAFSLGTSTADTLRASPASQYAIVAAAVEAERRAGARETLDGRPALGVLRDRAVLRDTLASGRDGFFWPRDELRTWTRCGFVLLRYEITGYDGRTPRPVMVLDLYNVPPHGDVEAEGLLPFRPGRWTFDFADGDAFSAKALRRAPG